MAIKRLCCFGLWEWECFSLSKRSVWAVASERSIFILYISLSLSQPCGNRPRDYQQVKGRLWEQCDHCNAFTALLDFRSSVVHTLQVCARSLRLPSACLPSHPLSDTGRQLPHSAIKPFSCRHGFSLSTSSSSPHFPGINPSHSAR